MHVHLDPVGGCAGDMFLAALLDAWPEHTEGLLAVVRSLPLPDSARVRVLPHHDHALTGTRFVAEGPEGAGPGSVKLGTLRRRLDEAGLDDGVRRRALDVFTRLAEAEGRVHGRPADEVVFHEVGAWDSVVDVVGAAWLLETLGPASWSVAPLPVGSGRVASAHGNLPVPAPATVLLLEGLMLWDDGLAGERVTPTGAAVLRHLAPAGGLGPAPRRLRRSGIGFGTRTFPGLSNVLRVLVFDDPEPAGEPDADDVAVVRFEVDDQAPEDLAVGLERLRAADGAIDVVQTPVYGKKGRLAVQVQLLARPEELPALVEVCFRETTTLGLRWHLAHRAVLGRRSETWVDRGGRTVEVKHAVRPGGERSAKAAVDDVAPAGGVAARARRRRRAEEAVLEERDD